LDREVGAFIQVGADDSPRDSRRVEHLHQPHQPKSKTENFLQKTLCIVEIGSFSIFHKRESIYNDFNKKVGEVGEVGAVIETILETLG